jgi:uncharacterized iron-regulated membrane protein
MAPQLNPPVLVSTRLIRWLFHLHRWTGIIGGIPLAIILFSGVVVVFKDEIDEFFNPQLLIVSPASSRLSVDQVLAPLLPAQQILLPDSPTRPYLVYRRSAAGANEQVAVDPYRGTVLGSRPPNGHLADVLRQIHLRFYYFGATGRIVVGVFGLLLAFSGITGLVLYPRFMRGDQRWYAVRWGRGTQWVNSDLHKLTGITTLVINLIWAISGAILGLENLAAYYRPAQRFLHPQPTVTASRSPLAVPLSSFLQTSRKAIEGFTPRRISLPTKPGQPVTVYGNTAGSWSAPTSSWVALDPLTGAALQTHDERSAHLATRAYNLQDPLHFGYFGGGATRWLWFVVGIPVSLLPLTGHVIWWKKRFRAKASS